MMYNDAYKRNVSGGLKAGNTDEQKLAASSNLNDAYANNLAHIASVGTQYRSHILSQAQDLKNAARNRKYGSDMAMHSAENESALNVADNGAKIGAGLMNVAGSMDWKTQGKGTVGTANSGNKMFSETDLDLMDFYKKQQQNNLENNPFQNYKKPFSLD